jgi:DNA repair ATPase RecN
MLKHLHVQNFTVFANAEFAFGPGLNVVVGANGTGKSHVLKLGYAAEVARDVVAHDKITPALREVVQSAKGSKEELARDRRTQPLALYPQYHTRTGS